jgi:dihydroceramide fatty acyl 2-hydroxylase
MKQATSPVDLRAALLPQVGALGEAYESWVHSPIRPEGSLRIFRSDGLERFTHIPWWLVLVVWVPVVATLHALARGWQGLAGGEALAYAALGLFLWTLAEYLLHRFVFHHRFRSGLGRQFHFLAHGIHHLDPWDRTRLVFPPLAGMVVAAVLFVPIWAALPLGAALATMSGLLLGYIVYDMTHYYTHHGKPTTRWGKFLKAYHLSHHHKHADRMWGVSQPLWDVVFRTGRPREPA